MFVLIKKGCISYFGSIIGKGEVVELDDKLAKKLMKSQFLELVEVEPAEETKAAIEAAKAAEPVEEPEEPAEEPEEPTPKRTREKKEAVIPTPDIEGSVGE